MNAGFHLGIDIKAVEKKNGVEEYQHDYMWWQLELLEYVNWFRVSFKARYFLASPYFYLKRHQACWTITTFTIKQGRKRWTTAISEQCFYINKIWRSWQPHGARSRPTFCFYCHPVAVIGCPFLWTYIQNAAMQNHVYHSAYHQESFILCVQCSVPWTTFSTIHCEEYTFFGFSKSCVLAQNVSPHTTYVTSPAAIFCNHNWKRTVERTVTAFCFVGLDEFSSRYKVTPFLIILATILHFLNDILQKPAPGLWELLSAGWAPIHFLSAGVAYVVTILTHRNGWRHVLHTYRTLEFFQNLPRGDVHLSTVRSTSANLWKENVTTTANTNVQGQYFIRQIKFITSCRYYAGRVCSGRPIEMYRFQKQFADCKNFVSVNNVLKMNDVVDTWLHTLLTAVQVGVSQLHDVGALPSEELDQWFC